MRKARETLLSLTLVALVFAGPAAVAAYFVAGDRSYPPLMLAAAGDGGAPTASAAAPVLAGVLYTKGSPKVDWNGAQTLVSDGSYAYLGGEVVSSGEKDMGVLQLEGDNKVYICPSSRMSLGRGEDGAYEITIYQGTGRFSFAPGTNYRIRANQSVYSPAPDGATQATVVEVAVFDNHPGGVACGFSSSLNVTAYPVGGGEPVALGTVGPGEVIDVSRALNEEAAASGTPVTVQPVSMPESVRGWLRDNAAAPGNIGYLCRCEELKRYAEADGIPDTAITPLMLPPETDSLVDLGAEEGLPPAALAVPGTPNPADPGVLGVETPLTVPSPLVPITGSGGGFVSTPS